MLLHRQVNVHAIQSCDEGQGQDDCGDDGQHPHDFIGPVRLQGIESGGKRRGKFLIVLNHIPHFLIKVQQVAPVVLHVLLLFESLDFARFKFVEHPKLWFEGGVQLDDVFPDDRNLLNGF